METRALVQARGARWQAYLELTKPRVVALMSFTVVVGMLLATPALPHWTVLMFGTLGIALVAGSGAALNHLVDRHADALMRRTRARPLPRGELAPGQVAAFAAGCCAAGTALLAAATNPACVGWTLASMVGYALVYSVVLKPLTPQNIVIGGAAGAMPPLLGWVAVTGQVEAGALVLFLIILVWTPPHFWALAIARRDDYARAGIPMLPVTHGVAFTARRVWQYSVALAAVSLLPAAVGLSGRVYLAVALALGGRFVWMAWELRSDAAGAMGVFRYSIVYLGALFGALLADRYL